MNETAHPIITIHGASAKHHDLALCVFDITPLWAPRSEGWVSRYHFDMFYCVDLPTARTRPETAWGKTGNYGIKHTEMTEELVRHLGWQRTAASYYVGALGVLAEQYHLATTLVAI